MFKHKREGIILLQYLLVFILFPPYCVFGQTDDPLIDRNGTQTNSTVDPYILELISITATVPDVPDQGDDSIILQHTAQYRRQVPAAFDARKKWIKCQRVIDNIRDQGKCASCWAVAAAAMISDRICIDSKGSVQIEVSMEDILTCCPNCTQGETACAGGFGWKAMHYWTKQGVVTGGELHSKSGCKPYSYSTHTEKNAPKCETKCTNPDYDKTYEKDKHFARTTYRIVKNERQIQNEIMNRGPVLAYFHLYRDFYGYKEGVYKRNSDDHTGNHFVKIIGWGVEDGDKFWLVSNTWGKDWGRLGGYFKILRGENMNIIESEIRGGRYKNNARFRELTIKRQHAVSQGRSLKLLHMYWILLLLFHMM